MKNLNTNTNENTNTNSLLNNPLDPTLKVGRTSNEKFKVGDFVRSYDFENSDDCFVEGVVDRVGGFPLNPNAKNFISFRTYRKIFSGVEVFTGGERVWVTQNGSHKGLDGGVTNNVVRIDNVDYTNVLKANGDIK